MAHQYEHRSQHIAASQVFQLLRAELAIPPTWMSGKLAYGMFAYQPRPLFPWLLLVGAAVVALAVRRRAYDELALLAIAAAALVGGTLGLLRADDNALEPWYVLMMHVGGATTFIALAWSTLRTIAHYTHRRATHAVRIAVAVIVIASTSVVFMTRQHVPSWMDRVADTMRPLSSAGAAAVPRGVPVVVEGPYIVDGYYSEALVLLLARAGLDVRVPPEDEYLFTRALRPPSAPAAHLVLIGAPDPASPVTSPAAGARRLRTVITPEGVPFPRSRFTLWYEPAH
jgi:hypothetical protein